MSHTFVSRRSFKRQMRRKTITMIAVPVQANICMEIVIELCNRISAHRHWPRVPLSERLQAL